MAKYICPMHPEVVSDKPGKCPKCGGMPLVAKAMRGEEPASHGHHMMMGAAQDFLRRFWVVTALLVPLVVFSRLGLKYAELVVATVIFYFAGVFFEHAKHEIKAKQYGMMTLVALAVGAGYAFSVAATLLPQLQTEFYLEISTLVWVLLFGHYLEARSSGAAGDALSEVAKLLPQTAHLMVKGEVRNVPVLELREKDVVLVKPGEKVPADGVIVRGEANFNEAHITGESRPVNKITGERVIAGAICADGSVEVRLDKVGENSTIGQIQALIAQAQQTKPAAQRLADRASRWLTFIALGVAILAFGVWSLVVGETLVFSLTLAITVLVIACPHALGLAIPTVSTIATQLAVKHGLFIKDLGKLELVKDVDWVVFDKTGTLTKGDFGVVSVTGNVLGIAGSLEQHSSHVIGEAIVKYAKEKGIKLAEVKSFKNIAGQGILGRISQKEYRVGNAALVGKTETESEAKTVVYVAEGQKVLGKILLADQVKPESLGAINSLHRLGVKVAMITGDNEAVAQAVAKELDIDTYFAKVLPEEKYKYVDKLQQEGERVTMFGDGVNDAPALTQADVGVAVGAGTDVAVEAGDVVLTRSNPQDIVSLIMLGKRTYHKMVENLVWALGYNVVAIPAAAGVFMPWGLRLRPEMGAIAMSLSSVIVVVNAFRLKRANLGT
jgi:P-type Cu2+ transporter